MIGAARACMPRDLLSRALFWTAALLSPLSALAADEPVAASPGAPMVVRSLELQFQPKKAFFMFDLLDGKVRKVPAEIVPPPESSNGLWLLASRLPVAPGQLSNGARYSIILVGPENRFAFIPPASWQPDDPQTFQGSFDVLRRRVNERVDLLQNLEAQQKIQSESLRRLRSDADTIAGIGRIVELKEEMERLKAELANTERDIERLKNSIGLAKARSEPRNMENMELELTRQISELNAAARAAEGKAPSRGSKPEQELQKRLALVASTRSDKLDELKAELRKLQQRRLKLESSVAKPAEPDSKAVYWEME